MPTQNSQGTEAEPAPELFAQVVTKLACVDLLCLDVDGVLTDGALYYSSQGEELKAFYTQDGSALKRLQASGVILAIISGRRSEMVRRRAAELGIEHLYEGQEDKVPALMELSSITGVDVANIAHVGDDIPDIALFDIVGCALTVADGHPQVRARADLVASLAGGRGAVRELADAIVSCRAAAGAFRTVATPANLG